MARVYKGYDENLDRYAAVKVIEPNLMAGMSRKNIASVSSVKRGQLPGLTIQA